MSAPVIAPPIRIELEWTLPLMMEVAFRSQKRRVLGRWARLVLFVSAAGFFAVVGYMTGKGSFLFVAVVLILVHLFNRYMVARYMKRELAAPLRQGKFYIELNDEGVDTSHTLSRSFYAWALVVDVVEAPLALHLKISTAMSQPIPYAALPEGVTPEDLRQRVEAWRAGGAFA